jgi:hemerythrin superfamily protein
MAKSKSRSRTSMSRTTVGPINAIALLKSDHRQVEGWFEEFEKSRSADKKVRLRDQICMALQVHMRIEEEIFYPAFLEAANDESLHHEAMIEHDGAKKLIGEILKSGPEDEYFDARVKVLSEMIKHHVKEEEQPGGMFSQARDAELDLKALGERMAAVKAKLMGEAVQRGGMKLTFAPELAA